MKHTPGPWHLQDYNGATISVYSKPHTMNPETGDVYPNGQLVAKVWLQGSGFSQDTAKLVAAAPEMLEALEAVIEAVNETYRDVWRGGGHDTQHFCPMCNCTTGHEEECPIPAVQAAYKKARGQK